MSKQTMKELTDYARSRIEGMEIGGEREALLKGLVSSMEIKYELDVPRWIPVTEELPDMWDERYLVSLAWGGVGVMEYKSTGFHNYGSFSPVPIETVTAWMPLPEPYTEVDNA